MKKQLLLSLFLCGACGSNSSKDATASFSRSCLVVSPQKACIEYSGSAFTQSSVEIDCTSHDGTVDAAPCVTTDTAGSCAAAFFDEATESFTYYYDASVTLDTAKAACVNINGTFTAGTKAACSLYTGAAPILSGQDEQRTRYQTDQVAYGATCVSEMQTRTCTNGIFSGWTGTYTYDSCTVAQPTTCGGEQTTLCSSMTTLMDCANLYGCTWDTGPCTGTPEPCSTFLSALTCGNHPGCLWQ